MNMYSTCVVQCTVYCILVYIQVISLYTLTAVFYDGEVILLLFVYSPNIIILLFTGTALFCYFHLIYA